MAYSPDAGKHCSILNPVLITSQVSCMDQLAYASGG